MTLCLAGWLRRGALAWGVGVERAALVVACMLCATVVQAQGERPLAAPIPAAAPAPVVLLTTYVVSPARLAKLVAGAQQAGVPLQVLPAEQSSPQALQQALQTAQLLVVDAPHSSVAQAVAAQFGEVISRAKTPYVVVGEFATVAKNQPLVLAPLMAQRGVGAAWAQRLREYWRFGGTRNLGHAMAALQQDSARTSAETLPAAVQLPPAGVYHPALAQIETNVQALEKLPSFKPNRPVAPAEIAQAAPKTVAIAVNNAVFTSDDTPWLDSLIAALEQRGLRAYAFYGPRQQKDLFWSMTHTPDGAPNGTPGGRRVADVLINAALVFNPTERKAELERIGIPVLQTMPALAMDGAQWAASKEGLAISDVSYYYTPAELSGMVDAMLITARHSESGALQPIAAQINAVADKAAALARLQQTPPAQRKVAMLVYNYPAGEGNFGASFLNVPKSLHTMLGAMQGAGYQTTAPASDDITRQVQATMAAFYKPEQAQALLAQGLADTLPLADYLKWFRALSKDTQARIEAYWGAPEKSTMLRSADAQPSPAQRSLTPHESAFIIPRLLLGNVVVMPQPLRYEVTTSNNTLAQRKKKIGHRSAVPLSHNYLATYLWIRTQLGAHALVHVGTHGTLEWAPGKERALSTQDDPLLALGDVPNIYPYIMDNLGEAITAKRRGRAVLVSHSTPMFSPAGFRPKAHDMHDLMHDWETVAPGPTKVELESRLIDHFVEQQYHRDLGWPQEKIRGDFAGFMELLHPYLDELAQTAQPLGLATFGEVPSPERRLLMVLQTLRKPLIDALGEDIDEVFLLDAGKLLQSRPARWLKLALTDAQAASLLDLRAVDAAERAAKHTAGSSVPNRAEGKLLDPKVLLALAIKAQQLDAALAKNEEISGFLAALDGKHLAASYGGDPVRNPESLPTGRNLYGFDASRVPTRQAWDTGVAAFDAWMAQHRKDHTGQWPEKIAFTLWAGETMRHQGVMESQAFYALGVKPRWDEAGRVVGIDTLAPNELNRPRIDVLLSVTGSYRDQLPTVMRWLDVAVRQVAALPAKDNFVARNSQAVAKKLLKEGASPTQAQAWSTARVFSNEQGAYGTGLSEGTLATDTWAKSDKAGGDAQLAQLYMARMGHGFVDGQGTAGGDSSSAEQATAAMAGTAAIARQKAYASNLAQVDAALLSRTSNTYGVLTSDDPFQYLGGIALAVRQLTGRDPALYVQNLRDESEIKTDSAAMAINKEMQTRYLHPQWIKAQQAEGYSGTLQVLKTANFLWGWQVTAPQEVRQDHWQSLHNVYVRDQYQLGTRKWLEGDNRAAFAQTLERMLDAVRLNYWQPDDTTRKELVQAYTEALKATGLRESNAQVQRFAAQQMQASGALLPVSPKVASRTGKTAAAITKTAATDKQPQTSAPIDSAAAGEIVVKGLVLEPKVMEAPQPGPAPVVLSLAGMLGVALLLLTGAWRQSCRVQGSR
jgi:cobaltochelatase CobN